MTAYILRRLLLMIPTLLGILFVSFVVVQFAPGGPVERVIAQLSGDDVSATARISGGGSEVSRQGAGNASMSDPVVSTEPCGLRYDPFTNCRAIAGEQSRKSITERNSPSL